MEFLLQFSKISHTSVCESRVGTQVNCFFLLSLEMDDHRITRMTKAEGPLRIMGMRIAYRVGLNFFDYKDESVRSTYFNRRKHL